MKEFIVFRLYGPMVSWGDIAVGEYRPTFIHPSKSSVLGLVAASLGVRRDEENMHARMALSYGLGMRVDSDGVLLRDYHTVQTPPSRKGVVHFTRKDEVYGPDGLGTILSTRDYRCDALYTVALWGRKEPLPYGLDEILKALGRPHFTPYLGRKSCPAALPFQANLVKAHTLKEAFDIEGFADEELLGGLPRRKMVSFYWEDGVESGIEAEHVITRRDGPVSRLRRQFSERREYYASFKPEKED